jgi:hypothetical protein
MPSKVVLGKALTEFRIDVGCSTPRPELDACSGV